jgi:hypothetical protein
MPPCTRPLSRPLSSVHIVFGLSLPVCRPTVCASSYLNNDIFSFPNTVEGIHCITAPFLFNCEVVSMRNYTQHREVIRKEKWRIHEFHILWKVHRDTFA